MIHLEVLSSLDNQAIGLYEYEFDQISIGRSKKNDLIFLDKELPLRYLEIKYLGGFLVVQGQVKEPFYFVNGKKVSGTLKLQNNDVIAFGENKIKVINAKATTANKDLSEAFEHFNQNSPELKFALEFIEGILLEMEKAKHV